MFDPKTDAEKPKLDKAIDQLFAEMENFSGDDAEYEKMVARLSELYKLKEIDRPKRVSRDTVALILGNIAVAALITLHERDNVITSKATSFLLKLR